MSKIRWTWPRAWAPSTITRQPQLAAAAHMSLTGIMMAGTEVMWDIWGDELRCDGNAGGECKEVRVGGAVRRDKREGRLHTMRSCGLCC
jgi:hypothetical protein